MHTRWQSAIVLPHNSADKSLGADLRSTATMLSHVRMLSRCGHGLARMGARALVGSDSYLSRVRGMHLHPKHGHPPPPLSQPA